MLTQPERPAFLLPNRPKLLAMPGGRGKSAAEAAVGHFKVQMLCRRTQRGADSAVKHVSRLNKHLKKRHFKVNSHQARGAGFSSCGRVLRKRLMAKRVQSRQSTTYSMMPVCRHCEDSMATKTPDAVPQSL